MALRECGNNCTLVFWFDRTYCTWSILIKAHELIQNFARIAMDEVIEETASKDTKSPKMLQSSIKCSGMPLYCCGL